ncbi:serine/threonine protein kinase [Pollutimonas subterranea]|uniref:Serine/threonine protein kinase n=1 Tax=Pollutimonas subterranea TaxID=2045210 RepID=A0A2N4U1F4_9BURK|nr:ATP-binding protein [Pollutimonas subterranea]PLC48844.1 serine/threonine protein kinase [Pollutimonas subterranea]
MSTLATLSLIPGPQAIPQALAWLESVAEQQHWAPRMAFKLQLCLDEALTNIVTYGFGDQPGRDAQGHIALSISAEGQRLALDIIDNGIAYDPTQGQPAALAESLDDATIGGHGLRLMQHYLEDIEYRRVNEQNHLRLTATPEPDPVG